MSAAVRSAPRTCGKRASQHAVPLRKAQDLRGTGPASRHQGSICTPACSVAAAQDPPARRSRRRAVRVCVYIERRQKRKLRKLQAAAVALASLAASELACTESAAQALADATDPVLGITCNLTLAVAVTLLNLRKARESPEWSWRHLSEIMNDKICLSVIASLCLYDLIAHPLNF
ncbi:unnamed protein product [Pedinophyceae sp. YPF-701]|nr:unnamed protein product [Pedinophyceae sp. YPF-701]